MKYEIRLHRSKIRIEIVECDTPQEAITRARNRCPKGFLADAATEILEDGEPGETHELQAVCENCEKWMWENDPCEYDAEGIPLCPACFASMLAAHQPQKQPR